MKAGRLAVLGARQHNLQNISFDVPRAALTVITGPSGSGKSTLAFDTIYAEGQRRYIESLSSYAKQFLERMPKPLVDAIHGLSPAVAIEQRNPTQSSRSTVGTATEISDYLRLLWARVGTPHCVRCGANVRRDTVQSTADDTQRRFDGQSIMVTFPLPASIDRGRAVEQLGAMGFVRALAGAEVRRLDELDAAALDVEQLYIVVDRIRLAGKHQPRLAEAVATAFAEGEGVAVIRAERGQRRYTEHAACSSCDHPAPTLRPSLFSFNNPQGACPGCNGFGAVLEYDEALVIPDPTKSLAQGALDPWTKPRYDNKRRLLRQAARAKRIPWERPWAELPTAERRFLLHGKHGQFVGVFPFLRGLESKRYKQYIRVFLRQYQRAQPCPVCHGARLNAVALSVKVGGRSIADVSASSVEALGEWLADLTLTPAEAEVAHLLQRELGARVGYLIDVGLGYLTVDRLTRSLSGGEAQRIALANALGSRLVETLYVLDEPTIGLHPRDTGRLIALLRALADAGNTVLVVEHDPATMESADYVVELGPGSGDRGGQLVYCGPRHSLHAADTLTAQYLSGKKSIAVPAAGRRIGPRWLSLRGARLHNLQGVDLDVPLGTLTLVTGVSGSGKSTLVHDILFRQLERRLKGGHTAKEHLGEPVGEVSALTGWESLQEVVLVDQAPIGKSPRSNPVTYIKAFDELRAIFAREPLARARGYTPATFSFNVAGGRCAACDGAGLVRVEMVFLADVFVPCEECRGTRYRAEVLDVRVGGLSIHDALQLTVDAAIIRFARSERLAKLLWHLQQVGLGYLRLGQPATTLSGGEAQRLKIGRELARVGARKGRRLYILDEPTTGLHPDDVRVLCRVLDRLVDTGHTVIVIEHHLDVIKRADWIVDMGPEGGAGGGRIVAAGTPSQIASAPGSFTGLYLRARLDSDHALVPAL